MPFLPNSGRSLAAGAAITVAALLSGCATRDRLTFPDEPGTGLGPTSTIDVPAGDTTVTAGPTFQVTGLVADASGIDTIYFETEGGLTAFPPEIDAGTSFRFGLPITTNGLAGHAITVRIFATDGDGNRGDTAVRVLTVQ